MMTTTTSNSNLAQQAIDRHNQLADQADRVLLEKQAAERNTRKERQ